MALITLPHTHNPDVHGNRRRVEDEKFEQTMEELAARFGGGALWRLDEGTPRGYWWDRGILYEDELAVLEVDIPEQSAAQRWLREYARDVLLPRFDQKAIYIKFVGPAEVTLVTVS
ncbi:MAG TPA: hypothetical protein VGA37_02505 [Gemmatimonadales bacterium]